MSSIDNFLYYLDDLEDPRLINLIKYPLKEILLVTLAAVLVGCQDWEEIVFWGESHLDWLQNFLDFKNGIACAETFKRVFAIIDSEKFNSCFISWVEKLIFCIKEKHIAIDGKTLRGSKFDSKGTNAVHSIAAFASEYSLVIGQKKCDAKTNEITTIPQILQLLTLEGAIITIDAIGAQKEIVNEIVTKKADYIISLKANQKNLYDNIEKDQDTLSYQTENSGHGHIEIRDISCQI